MECRDSPGPRRRSASRSLLVSDCRNSIGHSSASRFHSARTMRWSVSVSSSAPSAARTVRWVRHSSERSDGPPARPRAGTRLGRWASPPGDRGGDGSPDPACQTSSPRCCAGKCTIKRASGPAMNSTPSSVGTTLHPGASQPKVDQVRESAAAGPQRGRASDLREPRVDP